MMRNEIIRQVMELERENMDLKEQVQQLCEVLEAQQEEKPCNCGQCVYFIKHYVMRENGSFTEINHGHCRKGRIKQKGQYDTCKFFELK